jgi:RND family efflux transporter MFP subunit
MIFVAAFGFAIDAQTVERAVSAGNSASIELSASLDALEQADLYAKVSGYIETIDVDIGDRVQAGDVIAVLTIPEMAPELRRAQTDIAEARAKLEKAQADANLTEVTYKRYSSLYSSEPGAITEQEVDVAKAQQSVATAQVNVAKGALASTEAEVERLKMLMEYATIKAPFDGVITKRYLDTGALVVAGTAGGQPVVELMRTDKLRLVFHVPESAASAVEPGTHASVTIGAYKTAGLFDASVTRCSGSLMPDTRTMRAEIELPNSNRELKPGMFAKVELTLPAKESASE